MSVSLRGAATRVSALAVAVSLGLGLAACSSGADAENKDGGNDAPDRASSTPLNPAQRLAAGKTSMDSAKSMKLGLTGTNIPKSANGLLTATGTGTNAPAFDGKLTAQVMGAPVEVPVTAIDGKTWAKLPFDTKMQVIKPADYGAPDPLVLFSTDKGMSYLVAKTANPSIAAAEKIESGEKLTLIKGTLSGQDVTSVLTIGDPAGTYQAQYGLTANNQVRTMTITGPFYNGGTSTYSLRLTDYGAPADIKAPA